MLSSSEHKPLGVAAADQVEGGVDAARSPWTIVFLPASIVLIVAPLIGVISQQVKRSSAAKLIGAAVLHVYPVAHSPPAAAVRP